MTQQELTLRNLGQSLDDLANLDPRGYGVCKILYEASRRFTGGPTSMNAALKLNQTVKEGDIVYIMTGFVLRPYRKAEMDGIVSAALLCRALVLAFGAKPVIVCPKANYEAVRQLAPCVGLHLREDTAQLREIPVSMGVICFTGDPELAPQQAEEIIQRDHPAAVISVECPGANEKGVYHNATGLDVTELEAKQDVLFEKLQAMGVLNIAIGDLGNEIGMGALAETIEKYVPHGEAICAREVADIALISGVSNWWGWGVSALLSRMYGINLLPSDDMERGMLHEMVLAGSVDGCTKKPEETVDNLPMEVHLGVLSNVRSAMLEK